MKKFLLSFVAVLLLSGQVFAADYFGQKSEENVYTAGEAISIGDAVCFSDTTGYIYQADTDTAWRLPVRGLADNAIASGATGVVVREGKLLGQTSLTVGANVYVSATAGGITQTPVTAYPQILGYADTTTSYIINVQSYPVVDLGAVSATTGDFSGAVGVDGNFDVGTTEFTVAAATGNMVCSGTARIAGAVTHTTTTEMTGNVTVNTNKVVITAANGNTAIAGTLSAVGDFAVNTNKFNVTASSGNTTVAGTLGVSGATTTIALTANGDTTITSALIVSTVIELTDTDATPTVVNANNFITSGTTAITDFDDGVVGQKIHILAADSITITHDGSKLILNGAGNYTMTVTDTLTLFMFNDQVWSEIARSVN